MNLTTLQRLTAQAIVSIFETGRIDDYSAVSVAEGDRGVVSYGKHQATLRSGKLYQLVAEYCALPEAQHGELLAVYLPRMKQHDETLRLSLNLRSLLRLAGTDPAMQRCQDELFDSDYWIPALNRCKSLAFVDPLSAAVVYDSTVHGSWREIHGRTARYFKRNPAVGEREWITHYVGARHTWLTTNPDPLLRNATYRTKELNELIAAGKWDLALPITVRDVQISEQTLGVNNAQSDQHT